MSNVTIQKRGKDCQYKFEIAKVDGKRKFANKSGFKTKAEAEREGIIEYNNYINTGHGFEPSDMSYADLLDYWIQNYCYINLKYHTIEAYSSIVKNHIKPNIGFYKISQITALGLDFNVEMAKARDEKLPIATDIKENAQKVADTQLSRDIQAGQTEVKKEYREYKNPNIDLDNKSIDN